MNIRNSIAKIKKKYLAISLTILGFFVLTAAGDRYFELSKNIEIFTTLFKELNTYYVDDVDPNKLMETGIESMLASLDPFTNYISGADIDEYQLQTTGKYDGVGSRIMKIDDYIVISDPYEGYPAQKAGLESGDIILEIDGKSAKGYTTDQMSNLLKGQPNTSIKIKIRQNSTGLEKELTITRAEIQIKNVPYFGMINDEIGYIKLDNFAEKAGQEVADAMKDLKENNPKLSGVIFDLRGNGGGLLNEAINVANVWIDKGLKIVYTKGKTADSNHEYQTQNKPVDLQIPLIVLIDEGTASASEIVSGSIQDLDRGIVIGQNSYGKGLVQITRPIAYKSRLKVTTSKYYIPSGRCIQRIDYTHRDSEGVAKVLPDSLRKSFKTKIGRIVKDGAGIEPDVKTEEELMADVTISLFENNHFFTFANLYKKNHSTLLGDSKYKMTDAEYVEFVEFVKGKSFKYETDTEKALKALKKTAEEEKYFAALQPAISTLESEILSEKGDDLMKFKSEIKRILQMEIVSRYKYEKGRIASSLTEDKDIATALEYFIEIEKYNKLLGK
ncbi:MAG: S41 family peptidase [Bacteroidetes bacterium]|jgi:carboxyl-terminal processing protease|nr:S41 family peptidase [Bacteroidota bacterium]MBP7256709.1 S41 family peptidase [Chitinophagales bacterium]MBK7139264.1 S41 family peptidase [Bacteroidota bacterium]MBK7503826.1 S41 family peptidase [Bacteroidota bacterium]MBK8674103.1 S41 family peptidase [Bacteroidota bacterium]